MIAVTGQCVEPPMVDRMDSHPRGLGPRDEIANARVLPPGEHVQRVHGIRPLPQARGDGVKAEEGSSGGHEDQGYGRRCRTHASLC